MSLSEKKRKSNDKYLRDHYQRLAVSYPKAYVEKIRTAATAKGETLAGFVKRAIDMRLAEDPEGNDAPGQDEGKDAR